MPTSEVLPALSMAMLAEFTEPLSERDADAIDIISRLEDERITRRSRHNDIDDLIAEEISRNFAPGEQIRIHEAASSSAITSFDLYSRLRSLPNRISLHASDLLVEMFVVSLPDSPWRVIFDGLGQPLQFVGRRMVLSARRERRRYPINRLIRNMLNRTILPRAKRLLESEKTLASGSVKRISTFHPRARALAERDPNFTLGRADMSVPLEGPFDIVRAMHAFVYWKPPDIERALYGISAPLVDGGYLVIGEKGRSSEQAVTMFQRQGDRFVAHRDLAEGTAEKDMILGMRLSPGR